LNFLSYIAIMVLVGTLFEVSLIAWLLISLAILPRPKKLTIKVRKRDSVEYRVELMLNVGCGADAWGDIRLDRGRYSETSGYGGRTSANVIADAEQLPFRDNSFHMSRAYHVLEHVPNPQRAFDEILRVSCEADIKVPVSNAYSMLIEFLTLNGSLVVAPKGFFMILSEITQWPKRYSDHKWYLRWDTRKEEQILRYP
jgi:SAM-dependent methyltransferase